MRDHEIAAALLHRLGRAKTGATLHTASGVFIVIAVRVLSGAADGA